MYTQYPVIRNGHIRQTAEISGNFRKKLLTQRIKFKKHNETIYEISTVTGNYVYDLELVTGSAVQRLIEGTATLRAEVTR